MTIKSDAKNRLRASALAKRDALSTETRIQAAMAIADHMKALSLQPGQIVSGFWPIRSEIDIRPLMLALMQHGVRMALPVVIDKQTIIFRAYERAAPLVKAGFGTMGPPEDAPVVDPTTMLVPLAAYDQHGNRIGYGAGHYDRAIAKLIASSAQPRLIGVGFDCQAVDEAPAEPHDVPLDAVLTESGLHAFDAH